MTQAARMTIAALIIPAALLLQSCAGIKPGSSRSASSLYTTFFVGEQGLQYFIKPMEFKGENGEMLQMDITFRYKDEVSGMADLRFTYTGVSLIKKINRLELENKKGVWIIDEVELVYVERVKKSYQSRQSARLSLADTQTLFASPEWVLKITGENQVIREFRPKKRTQRAIDRLNLHIFEML